MSLFCKDLIDNLKNEIAEISELKNREDWIAVLSEFIKNISQKITIPVKTNSKSS